MADSPEAIKKSIRTYLLVMGVLFAGTILTYCVATVPWMDVGGHGFDAADCVLGLLIATVKATLVAAIFMHLNHEKKTIYYIFFGSFIFVTALGALLALGYASPIHDKFFPQGKPAHYGDKD
jgi:caa(3)-type oxidase subunit IV